MLTILAWGHLLVVSIFVVVAAVGQTVVLAFYNLFPFPSLLDKIFLQSRGLQSLFSFRLRAHRTTRSPLRLAHENGFALEEHFVYTDDGFVLALHRLVPPTPQRERGEGDQQQPQEQQQQQHGEEGKQEAGDTQRSGSSAPANAPAATSGVSDSDALRVRAVSRSGRPPVLLLHGLMQDSESLLCGGSTSVAMHLAREGFDVFVGNSRGNRFSHKHVRLTPEQDEYWRWSIDEMAKYDVPAMVQKVCVLTGYEKIGFVGFSQGTAQAFAAFSFEPSLADKISLFVALAPAARAIGLAPSMLSALVQSTHKFFQTVFGKKAMLDSCLKWQRILSPRMFVRCVDRCMGYLFSWDTENLGDEDRKLLLYPHIYSYTSVRCVEHWFQMMRMRRLAMFEDAPMNDTYGLTRMPLLYDISRVRCPVAIFRGGRDTIVETASLASELPACVHDQFEPSYEHLDFIWAMDAHEKVFPGVARILKQHVDKTILAETIALAKQDTISHAPITPSAGESGGAVVASTSTSTATANQVEPPALSSDPHFISPLKTAPDSALQQQQSKQRQHSAPASPTGSSHSSRSRQSQSTSQKRRHRRRNKNNNSNYNNNRSATTNSSGNNGSGSGGGRGGADGHA